MYVCVYMPYIHTKYIYIHTKTSKWIYIVFIRTYAYMYTHIHQYPNEQLQSNLSVKYYKMLRRWGNSEWRKNPKVCPSNHGFQQMLAWQCSYKQILNFSRRLLSYKSILLLEKRKIKSYFMDAVFIKVVIYFQNL